MLHSPLERGRMGKFPEVCNRATLSLSPASPFPISDLIFTFGSLLDDCLFHLMVAAEIGFIDDFWIQAR